jgi:hypothetical protein
MESMSGLLARSRDPSPAMVIPSLDDDALYSWSTRIPGTTPPLERMDPMLDVPDTFTPFATREASECPAGCRPGPFEESRTPHTPPPSTSHPLDGRDLFAAFTALADNDAAPCSSGSSMASMASVTSAPMPELMGPFPHLQGRNGPAKAADRCIIAGAELMAHLEARQREGLCALDEVLAINREAANKINRLIRLDGSALSVSCSVILTAAAEHVVSLFEAVVRAQPYSKYTIPCVGFGTFSIDPEEQAALRTRIISKELRLTAEVIRRLSTATTERRASTQEKVKTWLQELEQRIQNLIAVMESDER